MLDFDGSQVIGFLIDAVPAGTGYMLSVSASSDGGEMCSGMTSVDVTAQKIASVDLTANCTGAPYVPDGYGSLDVWVNFPGNYSFASLAYLLQGPAGIEAQGTVDISGQGVHFTLDDVPSGAGQTLSLTAQSTDGAQTCGASSQSEIVANQTATTTLTLTCVASPPGGDH